MCSLGAHPHPAVDYEAAMERVRVVQRGDAAAAPGGESIVLVHGRRVDRAIVLFHGFTNSPRQFRRLAEILYDRGANVLVPRLPGQALRDETAPELAHMTAEQLRDCADSAIDIALGMGNSVVVAGLSLGGSLAAWGAQYRHELARAVAVAPALALAHIPRIADPVLQHVVRRLPDCAPSATPDPLRPDRVAGWSTHAINEMVRLGMAIRRAARTKPPATRDIRLLLNAHDHTVSRTRNVELAAHWSAAGGVVSVWEFPDALGLPHDVVDPDEPSANTAASYPAILALIDGDAPRRDLAVPVLLERSA